MDRSSLMKGWILTFQPGEMADAESEQRES